MATGIGGTVTDAQRWLLTVSADVRVSDLARDLEPLEVTLDDDAVPLEPEELAIGCSGPMDLPRRLRARPHPAILGVYPDSSLQLY